MNNYEKLTDVIEVVREKWGQGANTVFRGNETYCIIGSLSFCYLPELGNDDIPYLTLEEKYPIVVQTIAQKIRENFSYSRPGMFQAQYSGNDITRLWEFNDKPQREKQDVIDVLKMARDEFKNE